MTNPMTEDLRTEASVSAAWLSDTGRVRLGNEDALVVADLTLAEIVSAPGKISVRQNGSHDWLLAVADGVGGAQAGEVASRIATENLAHTLFATGDMPVVDRLREGLSSVNHEVRSIGRTQMECAGMAATLTAVIIKDGNAIIGQVGDSRAYLIRAGWIRQLTKDQSMIQVLIDAGVLKPEEAAQSSQRNIILKALGSADELAPELSRVRLASGDCLLLCSDGLSNKVADAEMLEIVLKADTLPRACTQLVDLANERGGDDNITVILVRVDGGNDTSLQNADIEPQIRVEQL